MAEHRFSLPAGAAPVTRKPAPMPKRGAAKTYPTKEYTEAQQRAFLTHFVRVERSQWNLIQVGEYVRYVETDGKFRLGGTVVAPAFKLEKSKDPNALHMRMDARDKFGRMSTWTVRYDQIQDLYVAMPAALTLMQAAIERNIEIMHENMGKLVQALKNISARVSALEQRVRA